MVWCKQKCEGILSNSKNHSVLKENPDVKQWVASTNQFAAII